MNDIAYFIGGPDDQIKRVIERAGDRYHTQAIAPYSYPGDKPFVIERHAYRMIAVVQVVDMYRPAYIYVYDGREDL